MAQEESELWVYGLAMLACLIGSAFFSSSETAVTALSRARLYHLVGEGNRWAKLITRLREDKEALIGAILIGNNAVNIALTALATTLTINMLGEGSVWLTSIVLTVVVVIFCEILPKTYAIQNSERSALLLAPLLYIVVTIISPLAKSIQWGIRKFYRLLGVESDQPSSLISATDVVRGTIELHHQEGQMIKEDKDMLGSILDLNDVEVRHITVHRSHVEAIDVAEDVTAILQQVMKTGHSRLPFFKDDPDNIIGVLHVKDLIQHIGLQHGDMQSISHEVVLSLLQPAWFVPETTKLGHQLIAFRDQRKHIACVVDEYGDWQGIITLEDIIEEIVGDIDDEHDVADDGRLVKTPAGVYYVNGDMPIRDINRELDWQLQDDESATIAGLMMHHAKAIPPRGGEVTIGDYHFTVIDKQATRIKRVRMERLSAEPSS